MEINTVINQLQKFADKILTLNEPVELKAIEFFEKKYNTRLPNDYKDLIKHFNGFDLMGITVYGLRQSTLGRMSLEKNYDFEHYKVQNSMPEYLIPFSPDGYGSHYCFDANSIDYQSCKVVFWQHDYSYSIDDPPEITNGSFIEWINEVVIEWTLEDYDYQGNAKNN